MIQYEEEKLILTGDDIKNFKQMQMRSYYPIKPYSEYNVSIDINHILWYFNSNLFTREDKIILFNKLEKSMQDMLKKINEAYN